MRCRWRAIAPPDFGRNISKTFSTEELDDSLPHQIFRPSYGTVKAIVVECVKNAQRLASMAWKGTSMVNVQELFLN